MTFLKKFKRLNDFFESPKGVVALCLGLFALTVWTFLPALHNGFLVHDDYAYVQGNPHVNTGLHWQNVVWAFGSIEQDNWHPLTWLSHMLDVQLYGTIPWGHHLTNVLLHAANTVLIFLLFRNLTRLRPGTLARQAGLRPEASARQAGVVWQSFFIAGLFSLHPLRVESVAWISERKDVLSVFFGLLSLIFYVRYARSKVHSPQSTVRSRPPAPGSRRLVLVNYCLALLFFALSLMSKTMLVTLPFVFLLLDYWPLGRFTNDDLRSTRISTLFPSLAARHSSLFLEKVPFFALSPVVGGIAYIAQKKGGAIQEMIQLPFVDRFANALLSYARYLGNFFWPVDLCSYYPHPVHVPAAMLLPAGALVAAVSAWAWLRRRQSPWLFVGWFWYLGALVPVIGLVQLGSEAMADRYSYFPLIGINLLLVWGWCDLARRWRYGIAVSSVLATLAMAMSIVLTRHQIIFWKDDVTVWTRAIAATKDNYVAQYNLGSILAATQPDQALIHLQEAVQINPRDLLSQRNLGDMLYIQKRYSEAVAHMEIATQLEPGNGLLADNVGITLMLLGRVGEAIPFYVKAVEVDPQNPTTKDDLGDVLFPGNTQNSEAVSNFLAIARSDPAGLDKLWEALEYDTNHIALIANLGRLFAADADPTLRNGPWAVRFAKRACEITGYKDTRCVGSLAVAYAQAGRFDEAVSSAQQACSLASAANQPDLLKQCQELLAAFRAYQSSSTQPPMKQVTGDK